jgi:anti-sigma factor RsiW
MAPSEKEAVRAHLAACPECGKVLNELQELRAVLNQPLIEAPAFTFSPAAKVPAPVRRSSIFKPVFAAGLAAVLIVSGVFVGSLFRAENGEKKVSNFMYKTYSTIYDTDYYTNNYTISSNTLYAMVR